jgi:hypothetical protein
VRMRAAARPCLGSAGLSEALVLLSLNPVHYSGSLLSSATRFFT